MRIVDTHPHVSPNWFEPAESLLREMDAHGVQHAVLIQDNVQPNNEYQFECVRRFPGRFANVVVVDVTLPDAPQTLERLAERGACGLRLRQTDRSPGDDPLAIWRTAERLGLAVSCYGATLEYLTEAFAALVQAVPNLPIVIEHLGGGNHPDWDPQPIETRAAIFELARFPNLYVKIHGLGEFAQRILPPAQGFPFQRPIPPLLDLAYAHFGPQRMMWGSDYPPVGAREGFGNALRLPMEELADKSAQEREAIFGGTALRVFRGFQ